MSGQSIRTRSLLVYKLAPFFYKKLDGSSLDGVCSKGP